MISFAAGTVYCRACVVIISRLDTASVSGLVNNGVVGQTPRYGRKVEPEPKDGLVGEV